VSLRTIGGGLVIAASLLLLATVCLALGGGSVSLLGAGPGSIVFTIALVALAVGGLCLAIGGPAPFNGLVARIGLGMIAIGVATSFATSGVSPSSLLVLVFLAGSAAVGLGGLVTALALIRSPGRPRLVGLLFVGGVGLAIVAGGIANDPAVAFAPDLAWLRQLMGGVAVLAAGMMLAGVAGVGVLALTAELVPAPEQVE
jgi:hypothetical protein